MTEKGQFSFRKNLNTYRKPVITASDLINQWMLRLMDYSEEKQNIYSQSITPSRY